MTVRGLVLACLCLFGCTSESSMGRLVLALDGVPTTGPMADPGTQMVDDTGLSDLSRFPLFLLLRVEGEGLEGPVISVWPEVVPEEVPEEIELELLLAAGPDRTMTVDLILADETGPPATFVSPAPGASPVRADVVAGATRDVEIDLTELPLAAVLASFEPGVDVASVAWVDDRAGALLPPAIPEDGMAETALSVGRDYWPRVVLHDGQVLSLEQQRLRLEEEGERREVLLALD